MKSKVISVSPLVKKIKLIQRIAYEDKLTVFAAQTAFYICISAIPFIMLLLSLSRLVAPAFVEDMIRIIRSLIPGDAAQLFDRICMEIGEKSDLPIISTAAVTTLWSASRGVSAVIRGVSEVYETPSRGAFIVNIIRSLIYTVVFVAAIIITLYLLVFDSSVRGALFSARRAGVVASIFKFKWIILFVVLTLFFSVVYYVVSKGVFFTSFYKNISKKAPRGFVKQMPGAAMAALGWILFSFFYSLYFKYLSKFSYLYGSLAAVVFLMLWIYFCIVILLAGAELNKLLWCGEIKAQQM